MKIYISGPMTGYPEHNYPAFHAAEAALWEAGHEPINPARNFDGKTGLPWSTYMRKDIAQVLEADALLLLPGWELSRGANLEYLVAQAIEIEVYLIGALPDDDPIDCPKDDPSCEGTDAMCRPRRPR